MSRKKPGISFFVTIPADDYERIKTSARLASQEGEPIDARAMIDNAIHTGAVMQTRCQGCRSGKCLRHVAMVPSLAVDVAAAALRNTSPSPPDVASADRHREANLRHEAMGGNPASTVPLNLDKPGKIAEDSTEKSVYESVAPKTFALATVEPVKKPERKPRAKKVITEDSPEFTRLIDVYHVEFVRVRKEKPAYTSRDFAAFRSLLKSQGFDRASELIRNAFAHEFWANKVTIRKIADNPSEFVGDVATSTPSPRSRSTRQTEDVDWFRDSDLAKSTGS